MKHFRHLKQQKSQKKARPENESQEVDFSKFYDLFTAQTIMQKAIEKSMYVRVGASIYQYK